MRGEGPGVRGFVGILVVVQASCEGRSLPDCGFNGREWISWANGEVACRVYSVEFARASVGGTEEVGLAGGDGRGRQICEYRSRAQVSCKESPPWMMSVPL